MSPEPDVTEVSYSEASVSKFGLTIKVDAESRPVDVKSIKESADLASSPRKRRNHSPSVMASLMEAMSPASSTSTSQTNSGDALFEPTIDMMVNDFDDEQTLNEEEALAAIEQQDPHDEIATLKEESEMPLEELLAKYSTMPSVATLPPPRKKAKKSGKHGKTKRSEDSSTTQNKDEKAEEVQTNAEENIVTNTNGHSDVILIESGDEGATTTADQKTDEDFDNETDAGTDLAPVDEDIDNVEDNATPTLAPVKLRRSHLLDLYPEEAFGQANAGKDGKAIPLEAIYGEDDDEEEGEEYDDDLEDEETSSEYVKKTIMVGGAYQAIIPDGLSLYGDVLPYENEDKLIWEPSQVSESQVEEYLIKAREIKPSLLDDESTEGTVDDEVEKGAKLTLRADGIDVDTTGQPGESSAQLITAENKTLPTIVAENETNGVIKDNEQALHLLVQCGYDFKEALRRKRLNAVPLTGSMSLWSEEECHKFEEGIHKFGKDFLKIRQNQVRTRTMRELVQFYYLWKKSERRDHDLAHSDTVDHMDIYLNEGGDYSPNSAGAVPNGNATPTGNTTAATPPLGSRKTSANTQKNFSIMMSGNTMNTAIAGTQQNATPKAATSRTKRGTVGHLASGIDAQVVVAPTTK